jgi:hypothetical protein
VSENSSTYQLSNDVHDLFRSIDPSADQLDTNHRPALEARSLSAGSTPGGPARRDIVPLAPGAIIH